MTAARDREFRDFVLQRRPSLLRTATLLAAGDAHLAEDLVQTTLTRLYVSWPTFRRADNAAAYIQRSLVNALIDEERRSWRRRERSRPELPDRASPPSGSPTVSDHVARALHELPTRMRAAVVLRYFYDLSVAATADLLECTEGTVKSQTARALDKLRARLGDALTVPEDEPPPAVPPAARHEMTAVMRRA